MLLLVDLLKNWECWSRPTPVFLFRKPEWPTRRRSLLTRVWKAQLGCRRCIQFRTTGMFSQAVSKLWSGKGGTGLVNAAFCSEAGKRHSRALASCKLTACNSQLLKLTDVGWISLPWGVCEHGKPQRTGCSYPGLRRSLQDFFCLPWAVWPTACLPKLRNGAWA